jgi:aminobenzoyl-glutamate utilization protein B
MKKQTLRIIGAGSTVLLSLLAFQFLGVAKQTMANEDVIKVKPAELTQEKKTAMQWVDDQKKILGSLSDQIWNFAELSLQEFKSSALLADALREAGFEVTSGISNMPTAFVAEYGTGKPVIGILAEYDALPGLSQKAVSHPDPLQEGGAGHGCGHNVFGAACVGAAMAVKYTMERAGIEGTIRLYGCPAEENYSGKTYMARDGWFDDLDAALHWHPSTRNRVSLSSNNALNGVEIEFFGKSAHAAGSPWSGRSALDAVELLNIGMNYLREHVTLTSRIHYVITQGGSAANIVPDHSKVWYMVRDIDRQGVEYLTKRLYECAEGASLMTRTTYKVSILEGTWNMLIIEEGSKIMYSNLLLVGPPRFTEKEQQFARAIQREMNIEEKGLSTVIEPLKRPEAPRGSGSSDVSDVSWITPTIGLNVALWPLGAPGHHWSVVACGGASVAQKTLVAAAKTLASTALDLFTNPDLLKRLRVEWKDKTKGIHYKSAIPEGQKPPQFKKPASDN